MQDPPRSQSEIASYINRHYDPLRIAESIASHRFFESEPLIAVRQGEKFVVIEGNRRLTALKGLNDAELRTHFARENSGWNRLVEDAEVPQQVPVLVVDNAEEVAPLLGFRHISGIEPWNPYAQARYIARLVDEAGHTLDQVVELVGRSATEVKSRYRDYDILNQADQMFRLDSARARAAFGVFTNAMGRPRMRAFIGAPDPRDVDPSKWPLPDDKGNELGLLLELIFGGHKGEGRVVTDSRQLGELALVLGQESGEALDVLLRTRSLSEAAEALHDPADQFDRALQQAVRSLELARRLDRSLMNEEHFAALAQISVMLEDLSSGTVRSTDS